MVDHFHKIIEGFRFSAVYLEDDIPDFETAALRGRAGLNIDHLGS